MRYSISAIRLLAPLLLAACGGLTDVPDPSTIIDPNIVNTQDGAVSLYRGSGSAFASVFAGVPKPTSIYAQPQRGYSIVLATGFASDEFSTFAYGDVGDILMQRLVGPEAGSADIGQPYSDMHTARLFIDQAIGALRQYGKTTPKSYIGELFVLKGYLYIEFAELYCSGVPFTRAVYGGDLVLGTPETTTQMLEDAIAQFDTAISTATDSVRIRQIAAVGKARALLNLGRYADAAAAVPPSVVPTDYSYALTYSEQSLPNFVAITRVSTGFTVGPDQLFVANRRGINGLDYAAAGDPGAANQDPRVAWTLVTFQPPFGQPQSDPLPDKYPDGGTPVVLGSGVEARLIEAEAALQRNDVPGWEGMLNDLRESAGIPDIGTDSTLTASDTLRQNVMFRERAFWLYGTGHRFGDLRRLARQYHRPIQKIFPIGKVVPTSTEDPRYYVDQATFAPPRTEQTANPNYHGCINRDP